MGNDTQQPLVPKLRFPEFGSSAGWKEAPLSSVLSDERLKSNGEAEVHSVSLTKGVVPQVEHMGRSFSAADTSHYSLVRPFDVIYTKSPLAIFKLGIVKQHRGPHNALVSPLYGVFTPANKHIGQLIEAHFDSPSRSMQFLEPLCQKGAKNTIQISNDRFLSGKLFLPDDEAEQQKIAECLTSLDELIAAQARKVELLKNHKKGLMQRLFPREGETVPSLRFREFHSIREWATRPIGEFANISMCKRVLNRQTNNREGIPFYKIGTLGGKPDAFISRELYEEYRDRYSFPKKGEVLITCAGTVGKCVPYNGEDAYFQDSNIVWIENPQDDVSNQFLYAVLANTDWSKLNSTTITRIYLDDLRNLRIKVPPQKEEQQRIVDCLSALDDRIAAEAEKLDAIRAHKRGMMQQLFPFQTETLTNVR